MILLLASWICSMVLSSVLTPQVSSFLESHTALYTTLSGNISEQVQRIAEQQLEEETRMEEMRLPENLMNALGGLMGEETSNLLKDGGLYGAIGGQLAHLLIRAIAYMGVLLVSIFFFRFLLRVTNIVNYIPVIGGINKVAGMAVGFLQALLLSYLICMLISLISDSELGRQLYENIRSSQILRYLYHHNLLYTLILRGLGTVS